MDILNPACSMYFHLFHLVRVELLLDPLRQRRGKTAPSSGLTSSIVNSGREGVVDSEVACKSKSLARRRSRTMCQSGCS